MYNTIHYITLALLKYNKLKYYTWLIQARCRSSPSKFLLNLKMYRHFLKMMLLLDHFTHLSLCLLSFVRLHSPSLPQHFDS